MSEKHDHSVEVDHWPDLAAGWHRLATVVLCPLGGQAGQSCESLPVVDGAAHAADMVRHDRDLPGGFFMRCSRGSLGWQPFLAVGADGYDLVYPILKCLFERSYGLGIRWYGKRFGDRVGADSTGGDPLCGEE